MLPEEMIVEVSTLKDLETVQDVQQFHKEGRHDVKNVALQKLTI